MLRDKILEDVVKKHDNNKYTSSIGTITRYYHSSNCVDVSVTTKGTKNLCLDKIPLPIFGKGISTYAPQIGDKVVVVFTNDSALQGKIVSFVEPDYEFKCSDLNKHIDNGAYNLTIDIDSLVPKELKKPLSDYWIDEDNKDYMKYFKYTKNSPISELVYESSLLNKFNKEDIGFIHPTNKSLIKINNNGDIAIYSSDNTGISISTTKKTITIISDNNINNCDNWILKSNNVNVECEDFKVKAKNITLQSQELNIQTNNKKLDINEVIKEI